MFFDNVDAFLDDARFVVLPHRPQQFGIGAAMAEDVVATLLYLFDDLRVL